jgi:exodeoxyribonuclease-3
MEDSRTPIHLISLNTQGLRDKAKRLRLLQWLNQQRANIVFLQETHFTRDIEYVVKLEFSEWSLFHSYGERASRGCSIMIRKHLVFDILDFDYDTSGRYVFLNVELTNSIYTFMNIYASNNKKARKLFFNNISKILTEKAQGLKIIGGDFNEVLGKIDRVSNTLFLDSSKHLQSLIKSHNLKDIWRIKNKDNKQYTWRRKNSIEKSRIDFWLIEEILLSCVLQSDIRPALIKSTDHLAISLKLRPLSKRGPGYWKLNNTYLEDDGFINNISAVINSFNDLNLHSHRLKWELCKNEIKEKSIAFAKQKARERQNKLDTLEKRLKYLYSLNDNLINIQTKAEIIQIENEIENIYSFKARGAQIRSRIQLLENNEKKYNFFS